MTEHTPTFCAESRQSGGRKAVHPSGNTGPVHIIGAGLIGLSTADSLIDRGREVVIWDRAAAPGLGASFANSALLHPSQSAPWLVDGVSDVLDEGTREQLTREGIALSARSTDRVRRRMGELGLPPDHRGLIQIFSTEAKRDARMDDYARFGVRAETASWMGHPAVDIPEDSCADARAYSRSLAEDLVARGAAFNMNATVSLSQLDDGAMCLSSPDQPDVCGQDIVVAAGYATADLLVPLGLEVDVEGVAGHALRFRRVHIEDLPRERAVMDAQSRSAVTVLDDEIRISGGVGLAAPDDLLPRWGAISPALVKLLGDPLGRWTGQRPVPRSGRPMMGETPIRGLFVNAGHAHMGWTLSAGAGELVADTVMGREQDDAIGKAPISEVDPA